MGTHTHQKGLRRLGWSENAKWRHGTWGYPEDAVSSMPRYPRISASEDTGRYPHDTIFCPESRCISPDFSMWATWFRSTDTRLAPRGGSHLFWANFGPKRPDDRSTYES